MKYIVAFASLITLSFLSCNQNEQPESTFSIDKYSYNLGIIGGFSELVDVGVKKLAFSDALPPAEMDVIAAEAEKVALHNHVKLYREKDLIVTYLSPSDVAVGKDVLLIYNGNTLDEYLALKEEIKKLQAENKYTEEAKMDVSIRLGKMLSYPSQKIDELIAGNSAKSENPRQSRDKK